MACGGRTWRIEKRARAVMCQACRHAERHRGDRYGPAVACTIDGHALEDKIAEPAASCPRRRWPDAAGLVQCWGVRHIGVPFAVRRWAQEHWGVGSLAGCGCLPALKAVSEGGRGRWWWALWPAAQAARLLARRWERV